jgi:hypothetical protein
MFCAASHAPWDVVGTFGAGVAHDDVIISDDLK